MLWKKVWLGWTILLILFAGIGLRAQTDPPDGEAVVGEAVYVEPEEDVIVDEETAVSNNITNANHFVYLPVVTKPSTLSEEAQIVINLVNLERAAAGCAPVQAQVQLMAAAQKHSEDMALQDYFDHTSLDGRSPWDRMHAEGYSFSWGGENIAAGYMTAASVMSGWMNSSGHRANILNCNFTEIGVGYYYLQDDTGSTNYYRYWTQDFARPQ